jgi:hypothetical protein
MLLREEEFESVNVPYSNAGEEDKESLILQPFLLLAFFVGFVSTGSFFNLRVPRRMVMYEASA